AGDTGDVVARIADQREHVCDLRWPDAELLHDAVGIEPGAVLARVIDAYTFAHELEEILVDRHDRDLEAIRCRALRQRADYVVGFVALGRHDGDAHRLARLMHPVDLLGEVVRHRHAVRLVVVGDLIRKCRARQVERGRHVLRLVVRNQLAEHRHEHVDRVRGVPLLIRQPLPAKCVIGAVHLGTAVDEKKRGSGHQPFTRISFEKMRSRVPLFMIAVLLLSACSGRLVKKQYEYEEELYLALDGTATVNINASVPALVALRGAELNPGPRARFERDRIRAFYESPGVTVTALSSSRRYGRRFVHISMDVADVR